MTNALEHIRGMAPYALDNISAPPGTTPVLLSQNESFRPPSPAAISAAAAADGAALYPDSDWTDLRLELSRFHAIPADKILCGNGSLDLIACIARAFLGPGRAALAPEHAYPFFRTAAQMANVRFDTAPEDGTTVDVDALLAAARPDTAIVFVANPGNPTGSRIPKAELARLRAGLKDDVLLVIDEAYGEFADHLGERCFRMTDAGNTIVLRTFSKAYGLAGFRVGWGLFPPDVLSEVRKVMNPNNIAAVSQVAAIAALRDQAYMQETCTLTARLKQAASRELSQAGFRVPESHTNFLLIDLSSAEAASKANARLRREGIFLRPQGGAGLPGMLRMTIGRMEAMQAAIACLNRLKEKP